MLRYGIFFLNFIKALSHETICLKSYLEYQKFQHSGGTQIWLGE